MVLRSTSLCVVLLLVSSGCAQHLNGRHATLQNNVDYTSQFVNPQNNPARSQADPVESGNLADDPFIKNLFQEFLVQYQQLANERKTEASLTTTSPGTIFKPDYSMFYTSPPSYHTTPSPQKRRLSPRRKMNSPPATRGTINHVTASTTPFSTLLSRVNSLHHNSVESTTAFPSLRQRYFGIEPSKPKKISSTNQQTFPMTFRTTPAPQVFIDELPSTTQPPRSAPNFKIPQHLVNIPSKPPITSSKMEIAPRKKVKPEFDEDEFRRQAEGAQYEFASDVNDEINGNLHQREEVRDGLAVKGRYSFSDGYFKRTVTYEADEKGYRVVKQEVEPLEGPQGNPDGEARVSNYVSGSAVNYQITKEDIQKRNQKTTFHRQEEQEEIDEF